MPAEIPFIRPNFPKADELVKEIDEIVSSNWYTNFGPKERKFARALGAYLGHDLHVATFANGTFALIAALHTAIGPGGRDRYLLMPSFTFIAVAQAALWTGYRPWFIDIDPDTWQPDVQSAGAVLQGFRDRIAGILLPNVFGVGNPQVGSWEDLAREWNLPIVIDSAAGFGSEYSEGDRLGSYGFCEIFSFHATKPFAIGEGGALVSRDARLVEQARQFGDFGFAGRESTQLGMNGKLPEISAAIGLVELAGLDDRLASRRMVLERYRAELGCVGLEFQSNADRSSVCFASVCCESADHKAAILKSLGQDAIRAHDYYNPPQHLHPYLVASPELSRSTDLAVTADVCSRIVSLPVHHYMASDDVLRVVAAVRRVSQ
ncbi:MAG: DegT/DnrJ/EryC1/StrS family aminotransferase [Mycobacteriaceae bacterium]|nr:DegT/DnrJ/EryC1/StrS family aminotransferase [Mycobacteriaceae bacterium]